MLIRAFVILGLLVTLPIHVSAQAKTELDKLDEKLRQYFERMTPGWKHERVEPLSPPGTKSEGVLIEYWSFSNRKVKISILVHKSAEEAKEVLQTHRRYSLDREELSDLADEGFSSGYGSSDVAFRKGRFTVYVSTTAEIGEKPEERMLSQSERFELMKSEMRRWSQEFAKQAAKAIDDQ